MKISYNWLKEIVNFKASPKKLANDLTDIGLSVESIQATRDDYILDFDITANRGDLLSIFGISREISALYDMPVKKNEIYVNNDNIKKKINIKISDYKLCSHYSARIIDNIKITKSPDWLIKKLTSYGFRPLNNIVDVTNYIMILTGQPMHAFDYAKISNGNINIKLAKNTDEIITIDGVNRSLKDYDIVISDGKKIYDLSGIMGAYNSEIDKNTKTIVLQSAIFNPVNIRNTSKRLRHTTDASYRYERGVDTAKTKQYLDTATNLIKSLIPNSKISKLYHIAEHPLETNIKLNFKKVNSLTGLKLKNQEIIKLLEKLNFTYNKKNTFSVPSYRSHDIKFDVDLIEEVVRIYGYKHIKPLLPSRIKSQKNNLFIKKECIKDILSDCGFCETHSYSFTDKNILKALNIDINKCVEIINPISPENKYLRPTLITSMLNAYSKNPWAPQIDLFETGKIFSKNSEKFSLYIATNSKNLNDLKNACKKLDINPNIKKIPQNILDKFKIRKQISYIEIFIDNINIADKKYKTQFETISYQNISEFAPTIRDFAFVVDRKTSNYNIIDTIHKIDKHIFIVELFDEFISSKLGKNKKSVAFHVWMQDLSKPLKTQQADQISKKIINKISTKFKARLR